jgi:hypothetical protein
VFRTLNEELKEHRFRTDKDVKAAVVQWFQQQPSKFFVEGIYQVGCLPQQPWGLLLMASTPLRTIPEWV